MIATFDTDATGQLQYAVRRGDRPLLQPSRLGITVNGKELGFAAKIGAPRTSVGHEDHTVVGGHTRSQRDYAEAILPIQSGQPASEWSLEVRVFDDAVAYRYRVPGEGKRRISGEASEWRTATDSRLWYQVHTRGKDYEARYQVDDAHWLVHGDLIAAPVLAKLPKDDGYAFITEANLINYSDMGLTVTEDGRFQANFHNDGFGFELTGEILTPWRVTILTKDLNGLVNSDTIQDLCPPPAPELADADWIKPGRSVWHWRVTGPPKFEDQHQWVDWAAALGFEYVIVDDGWKRWNADGKDAWALLHDVTDYAETKNVAIIAWVHSNEVTSPQDRLAYMQKARDCGLAGLKIDFMQPANVEWVEWYDQTLRDAAKFHLTIDYHGALKPTGRERTWPNELNREGIGGREQGKLSGLHDTTLPFTRLAQGHADYTPTEFRPAELHGNTVAKELAQAIVYTSPLLVYSGVPQDYLNSPAVDVIKAIPSTWDETIVLPGSAVGDVAAFARRKGDAWFIGVINGEKERTLDLSLTFLGKATTQAVLLSDTPDKAALFDRQERPLASADVLHLKLSKDGGFVAWLKPTTAK